MVDIKQTGRNEKTRVKTAKGRKIGSKLWLQRQLNDPFVRLRSEEFSQRLRTEAGNDIDAQIRLAFQLGLARQPATEELTHARSFLIEQTAARRQRDGQLSEDTAKTQSLTDFCQMLFSFNEFIYVD